jgi:Flp pilus assembly protein TadG
VSDAERGSAAVESMLVIVLLVALVLGVLQVGAVLLVRNTALDAAAEGARWAAVEGNGPDDGVQRTRQVLTDSLGRRYATDVRAGVRDAAGAQETAVTVSAPLPVLGLLGPASGITVTGHALLEPAP